MKATDSEQILREVSSIVDSSVHGDESLHRRLVLHIWVVEAGVQHDDGEGQDVTGICDTHTRTDTGTRVTISTNTKSSCHCWMEHSNMDANEQQRRAALRGPQVKSSFVSQQSGWE